MNSIWLLVLGLLAVGIVLVVARRRETRVPKTQDANIPVEK